jgi:hypothetical protein
MKYYTIHINDSGAIEDSEESLIDGENTLICEIYDDVEFNKLNDILHSLDDYIINEKALNIFKGCNIIPYKLRKVIVNRKENKFGIFKTTKAYNYAQLKIEEPIDLQCYNWINFEESDITVKKGEIETNKLQSHLKLLELVEENGRISSAINEIYKLNVSDSEKKKRTEHLKTYSWITKKIVFNNQFDFSIDLFKIPYYSWGTYVSERLKNKLSMNRITDIGFAETKEELGKVWKPHFPIIEFETKE